MNTSFEKVLNEVIENYKRKVETIHQSAQQGQAASPSDMNAFISANAQVKLVSLLQVHIKKNLIANESDLEGFLKRAKASAVRERSTSSLAVVTLCDKLIGIINTRYVQ